MIHQQQIKKYIQQGTLEITEEFIMDKEDFSHEYRIVSILLIFVVLCLSSPFSILSIVSANADKKLSLKSFLNRSIAYYNACNEAETTLKGCR